MSVHKGLLETGHTHIYRWSLAAFALGRQQWVVVTEEMAHKAQSIDAWPFIALDKMPLALGEQSLTKERWYLRSSSGEQGQEAAALSESE